MLIMLKLIVVIFINHYYCINLLIPKCIHWMENMWKRLEIIESGVKKFMETNFLPETTLIALINVVIFSGNSSGTCVKHWYLFFMGKLILIWKYYEEIKKNSLGIRELNF